MRCGIIRKGNPDQLKSGIEFIGNVSMLDVIEEQIVLRKNARASADNDNIPDFEILAVRDAREYPLGSAWIKNGKSGDFLSVTLDKKNWDAPLNIAAFPPDKGAMTAEWTLQWSRPRREAA